MSLAPVKDALKLLLKLSYFSDSQVWSFVPAVWLLAGGTFVSPAVASYLGSDIFSVYRYVFYHIVIEYR